MTCNHPGRKPPMRIAPPAKSETRHAYVAHKWLRDLQCKRRGHSPSEHTSAQILWGTEAMKFGGWWPICERCGFAVNPDALALPTKRRDEEKP